TRLSGICFPARCGDSGHDWGTAQHKLAPSGACRRWSVWPPWPWADITSHSTSPIASEGGGSRGGVGSTASAGDGWESRPAESVSGSQPDLEPPLERLGEALFHNALDLVRVQSRAEVRGDDHLVLEPVGPVQQVVE